MTFHTQEAKTALWYGRDMAKLNGFENAETAVDLLRMGGIEVTEHDAYTFDAVIETDGVTNTHRFVFLCPEIVSPFDPDGEWGDCVAVTVRGVTTRYRFFRDLSVAYGLTRLFK